MHAGGKKKKNVPIESAKYFLIERPKRGGRFLDLRETCESHRGSVIVVIFVKEGEKKQKNKKTKPRACTRQDHVSSNRDVTKTANFILQYTF